MIALAVVLLVALALYVWLDAYPLLARLVTLRERRLDADLATEQRVVLERERTTRAQRAVRLPDDIEGMAREWGEFADSTRRRAQELFATLRDEAKTDDEAWAKVRVVLTMESTDRSTMEVWS